MSALSDIAMKNNSDRTSLEKAVLVAPDKIIQNAADILAALEAVAEAAQYAIESQAVDTRCKEGLAVVEALAELDKVRNG